MSAFAQSFAFQFRPVFNLNMLIVPLSRSLIVWLISVILTEMYSAKCIQNGLLHSVRTNMLEVLGKFSELRANLANNMARHRKRLNWTQYDLAAAVGISVDGLRNYEQKKRWPDPEDLEAIASAMGVTPIELLSSGKDQLSAAEPTPAQALRVLEKFIEEKRPAAHKRGHLRAAEPLPSETDELAALTAQLTPSQRKFMRLQAEELIKRNRAKPSDDDGKNGGAEEA